MFSPLFHNRHLPHSRRRDLRPDRACREIFFIAPRDAALPQGPRENNLPGINVISGVYENAMGLVRNLFSREYVLAERTHADLADPRRWIEAFRQADVFSPTQTLPDSLRGKAFGPKELLRTMSPADRVAQLWNFARETLPPRLTRLIPPGAAIPPDNVRDTTVTVIAIVLGLRAVDGETRPDALGYAKEAFDEIYPAHFGRIYEDYRELARQLGRLPGPAGQISPELLRNRDRLLKIIAENEEHLPPGRYLRFVGWLRVNSAEPADRKLAEARLAALGEQLRKDELRGILHTDQSRLQLEQLQKGVKMDAERRNRTFMHNFEMLEPWQQYAVIGLGLFAAWKLWKKPGRFLGIIPYWTIPTGVVGLYLYRRLIAGDHDALNTMTGATQRGAQNIWDWTNANILSRGILTPTVEREDATRMSIMARFLNQRAFLSHFPIAAPMMTVAEIKMKHFAGSAFRAEMAPGNRIRYSLYGDPRSAIYLEAQGVIKRRRYDRNVMHRIFFDDNAAIAQGIGAVFYHLAARRPENGARVKRIEDARRGGATVTPAGTSNMSYDNISDPEIKQDFLHMIGEGRVIAMQDYPEMNLVDLIQTFVAEPSRAPERPDNADRVAVPNLNRPGQLDLLAIREQPLLHERKISIETIKKEFKEWLNFHSSPRFPVIKESVRKKLENYATALLSTTGPLPEIIQALERIKYVILATAAVRGGENPISDADVETMLGAMPGGADEPGFIPGLVNNVSNWFNRNILPVASNFQTINDLENVRTILRQRLFSGVESGAGGLGALQKQMTEHRARFDRLRNGGQAAELFALSLDAAAIGRLGGPDQVRAFLRRLTGPGNPRYLEFIASAERFYAQRVANDIVAAQIGTHRRGGDLALDLHPPRRFISPQEEQNLIANNDFLLEQIIGSDSRPLNGMWAAMFMRQTLSELNDPGNILNVADEQSCMAAVNRIRRIAASYIALQPISPTARTLPSLLVPTPIGGMPLPPLDLLEIGVHNRVREIAREFLREWNNATAAMSLAQKNMSAAQAAAVAAMAKVRADNAPALKQAQEQLPPEQDIVNNIQSAIDAVDQAQKKNVQDAREALEKAVKHRETLLNRESFREGVRDISATMRLLGIKGAEDYDSIVKAAADHTPPTLLDALQSTFDDLVKLASGQAQKLGKNANAAAKELGENAKKMIEQINQTLTKLISRVEAATKELRDESAKIMRNIEEGFAELIVLWEQWQKEGGDAATELGQNVQQLFKNVEEAVREYFQRGEKARKEYDAILQEIQKMRKTALEILPQSNARDTLIKAANDAEGQIKKILASLEPPPKLLEQQSKKIMEILQKTQGVDQLQAMRESISKLLKQFRELLVSQPPPQPQS